jgi:hypothetical protein
MTMTEMNTPVAESARYTLANAQDQSIRVKSNVKIAARFMDERLMHGQMSSNDLDALRLIIGAVEYSIGSLVSNLHTMEREPRCDGTGKEANAD